MTSYLLDTHILIWWYLGSPDLPKRYLEILKELEARESSPGVVGISIISLWEVAQLVDRGRIHVPISLDRWFQEIEESSWLTVFGLSHLTILESVRLGTKFHKDPADRFIVATARMERLKLMTVDQKIIESGVVTIA